MVNDLIAMKYEQRSRQTAKAVKLFLIHSQFHSVVRFHDITSIKIHFCHITAEIVISIMVQGRVVHTIQRGPLLSSERVSFNFHLWRFHRSARGNVPTPP